MDVIIARGFLWRKQELEIVNIDVINEKTVIRWICFKLNPHFIIERFHLVTCIIQSISYVLYASLYSLLYLTDFFLVIADFRSHLRASLAFSHWSNCIYPSLHIYRKNGLRSWDYLCSEDVVCLSCRGTMVNLKTEDSSSLRFPCELFILWEAWLLQHGFPASPDSFVSIWEFLILL